MPSHKQTPCRAGLRRNMNKDRRGSLPAGNGLERFGLRSTEAGRVRLGYCALFLSTHRQPFADYPNWKFSGCGTGLRLAGSRSLWLRDSGGVGTSAIFHLPSPISHPSCILYTESSESFSCILYTEFSESWTAASFACMVDDVRVTKNNGSSLPASLAPHPACHLGQPSS